MYQLIDLVAGLEHTPSQSVARREAVAAVQVGLATLNEDDRRLLELRFLQDLTIPEVAEAVGKKPRAVRDLCRQALEELRLMLGRSSQFFSRR
jgi:RNA polymerase sigma factor (sigma-70 family)